MSNSDKIFDILVDKQGRIKVTYGMRYYKKTNEQNNMVRFIIKLKSNVDKDALLYAFEKALNRHRTFRFVVVSDDKNYYLKEGDIVTVSVNNSNQTISQQLKNFFYKVVGQDTYTIASSHGGMVTATGK